VPRLPRFFSVAFLILMQSTLTGGFSTGPQPPDTVGQAQRLEMFRKYLRFGTYLDGGEVAPHWMSDGDRFWYADEEDGDAVYRLVDPRAATVSDLFDVPRLREAIESATGREVGAEGLPFRQFDFSTEAGDRITFELDGERWELELDSYGVRSLPKPEDVPRPRPIQQYAGVPGFWLLRERPSPDGRWTATLIDENLALREVRTDSIVTLTTDGSVDQPWGAAMWEFGAWWSPDSRYLLAGRRANPIAERWPLVRYPSWEEVPEKGFAPSVEMWPIWWWAKTSEAFELYLFDLESGTRTRVPIKPRPGQWLEPVEWLRDGSAVLLVRRGPEARVLDLLVINPEDASVRLLDSESVDRGSLYPAREPPYWRFLEDGRRFIFRSERDGYQNLVLYDVHAGFLRVLTSGPHPVRWFREHEATGWVYFAAQLDDGRPYDRHLARVPLTGGTVERLSNEPGQHFMSLSPSGRYILDHHVANDRPMRTDLKTAEGRYIMTLESGSTDRIREELHWSPPEEFSVVAPDGVTKLYGTLFKPWDFNPGRSYPVIDQFNALHGVGSVVLRSDPIGTSMHTAQAVAQLGFVVVTLDARGTYWRGRDFRLSTWGSGDTELIPEHVHALRMLASERPWMDLEHVGALGHSHFGYQAARAMVMAPDFYDVGVSSAGPDRQGFAGTENVASVVGTEEQPFRSNSSMAANLKGRLLLIVGTDDFQGPLYAMMPLMDALVEADKQFDFRLIPGAGHGVSSPRGPFGKYYWDAVAEHFLRYLKN